MSRATECFSMYSDMSRRTSARLVVEQEAGQRLGQLGLADACGAEEHERAHRPVRILQAGAGAAHGGRDRLHGLALADDALGQILLHVQQLLALALEHLVDRHAGPARDDLRHVVGRHRLFHQAAAIGFSASTSASSFSSSGMTP